jgi:hypothetical protein
MSKSVVDDHTQAAKTHQALSDECSGLAECFGSMSKAAAKNDSPVYAKAAGHFGKMAATHKAAALYHGAAAKAADDELGKTLRPDSISGVPRTDAPDSAFGIRAVPRPGQPELGTGLDKATLDSISPMFRHLVETGDEV